MGVNSVTEIFLWWLIVDIAAVLLLYLAFGMGPDDR